MLGHQLPFPPRQGGGVENLVAGLARVWCARGHEVVAYSRAFPDLPTREMASGGLVHRRLPGRDRHRNLWIDHLHAWRYARRLRKVLEPADVTSFHTPFSFLFARDPRLGVVAHTIHRTPKWIVRLYRRMDRLYGGSEAVIRQARAIDPSLGQLKCIYNGYPFPDAPPPPRPEGEGVEILFPGRCVPDKGVEPLIRAVVALRGQWPGLRLTLLGPQRDEEGGDTRFFRRMQALVASAGLRERIRFAPPLYDRSAYLEKMARADVIAVPTISGETFSMAILEAMSLAKPVLTSDFPPMLEAVRHRETGYVAPAGEVEGLAWGISWLIEDPGRLRNLGERGFARGKTLFDLELIADAYLADFAVLREKKR